MIDQDLIKSGYDIEVLLSESFFTSMFITQVDTGTIPTLLNEDEETVVVLLLPPTARLLRTYPVNPDFVPHNYLAQFPLESTEVNSTSFKTVFFREDRPADEITVTVELGILVLRFPIPLVKTLDIHVKHEFKKNLNDDGSFRDAVLSLAVADISGPVVELLSEEQKTKILEQIKKVIDRDYPISIQTGIRIEDIEMKKMEADDTHDACVGIYVNLVHDGSSARGNTNNALNFLTSGSSLCLGTSGNFYAILRSIILKALPDEIGSARIDSINVGPHNSALRISISGEFVIDNLPDPDYTLNIDLKPYDDGGFLSFEKEVDLDISAWAKAIAGIISLGVAFFNPIGGAVCFLISESLLQLVDEVAENVVEDQIVFPVSMGEIIPTRLMVEERYWDPVFKTMHCVQGSFKSIVINEKGVAFEGGEPRITRKAIPEDYCVIVDKVRDEGVNPVALVYRIPQNDKRIEDRTLEQIATLRSEWLAITPPTSGLPAKVDLSYQQILDRIENEYLVKGIECVPFMIDRRDGQILSMFILSKKEIGEITRDVTDRLRQQARDNFYHDSMELLAAAELTRELDREPTQDEINNRVNEYLDAIADYEYGLDAEIFKEKVVRGKFNMFPDEVAKIREDKIISLDRSIRRVKRLNANGTTTVYLRDNPDGNLKDNLLELPVLDASKT